MAVNDVSILRNDVPNAELLNAVRSSASTDYVARIPAADKAGIKATINALMDPNNRRWRNEFIDVLVNRIGLTIARSNSWSNPLAPFKRGMLQYGNTIEEIQTGLLQAHNYSPDRDYMEQTLFSRETPEVQANFHTINRQDFYKVTINESLLNRAFLDPTGLSGFINQLMEAPSNSDQLDEFLLTCSLFREYEANGGFYHVNVPDVRNFDSTGDEARLALRKMRAMADSLKFLSTKYNAASMPIFARPEQLIIFASPEFNAAVDVDALAGAFNIERALMHGRVVVLPQEQFGISECQAILTTEEFFVMADAKFESTSQWNPANLHNNYFLHHWEVISCSRFAPAVMFTTGNDDEVLSIYTAPTSVATIVIQPDASGNTPTGIYHGGVVQLATSVNPTNADQGVLWKVSGGGSGTFITQDGVLHLGAFDPISASGTLTVSAYTTDVDPNLPNSTLTKMGTLVVTVADGPINVWPVVGSVLGISVAENMVPSFTAATHTYNVNVPSGTTIDDSDVVVFSNGPVDTHVTVVDNPGYTAPQYTVTIVTKNSENDTAVTYTVNVTNT